MSEGRGKEGVLYVSREEGRGVVKVKGEGGSVV